MLKSYNIFGLRQSKQDSYYYYYLEEKENAKNKIQTAKTPNKKEDKSEKHKEEIESLKEMIENQNIILKKIMQ